MLWPTILALRALGGSGHHSEIAARTIEIGDYSEAQQALMMPNGRKSRLEYNVAWCLSALKAVGRTTNSARGVWALTEASQELTEADMPGVRDEIRQYYREVRRSRQQFRPERDDHEEDDPAEPEVLGDQWKDELLSILKSMDPVAFEHLCKRLLRESGFRQVEVTKASGDGGIDGVGMIEIGLVSFPTYFQCKRYDESVGSRVVRDFRGAMAGRGEKGLVITTGTFTTAARDEATRDGVPPIDLVDGDRLCDLLKAARLGVAVEMVERVTVRVEQLVEAPAPAWASSAPRASPGPPRA